MDEKIEKYLQLVNEYPEAFTQNDNLKIRLEKEKIERWVKEHKQDLGIVFHNGNYFAVVADLVEDSNGKMFRYARILHPQTRGRAGTVVIPKLKINNGQELFGLLEIYRHAPRKNMLEFPRGYLANQIISAKENAIKEFSEEFNLENDVKIVSVKTIGNIYPDSGLTDSLVSIVVVEIETDILPNGNIGCEGIFDSCWITENKLLELIKTGKITDGFTVSAMMQYLLQK